MNQRILFRLTSTHLIVANTGKVFTKEGLESLGYTDTSTKISKEMTVPNSVQEARDYILDIVRKKCTTFKNDPQELVSAGRVERRTTNDYTAVPGPR